jgi:hypothetical protein
MMKGPRMFREDISGYSEPPRPPRNNKKTTPWVPVVLVAFVVLGVAHVAGLTKPIKSLAMQLAGYGQAPGYRLVGDWESDDDPMFKRICYAGVKGNDRGTGFYMADRGRGMREVLFQITSEDRSGRRMEMAEFLPGVNENYKVTYSIAGDSRSMTREYDDLSGMHVSCRYRYVGPPTEEPPPIYDAESIPR